jgi:hypothetical protein
MAMLKYPHYFEFFSRKSKKLKTTAKNPSCKDFCENFMDDGNVPLKEFYQIPSKKNPHHLRFFFRKWE